MPISSVIFDLGRTLVPFSFAPLEPHLVGCRAEVMREAAAYEIGACDWPGFQDRLAQLTRLDPSILSEWWCQIFTLDPLLSPELIRGLRGHYRVGLLSNTNELHFRYLCRELPWLCDFDFHTLSFEVGAAKPQPEIYAAAERQAACAPQQILFFDDVPEFVAAARARGWRAEQFRGEPDVRKVLAELAAAD